MKIEKIVYNGKIVATIIRNNVNVNNTIFFTPPNYPLQLGLLIHKKGEVIKAHVHKKIKRIVTTTQEVLYFKNGKARVYFYDNKGKDIKSSILKKGDIVLFATGGHGLKMLENTEIIEVKQGPYFGVDEDKIRFK